MEMINFMKVLLKLTPAILLVFLIAACAKTEVEQNYNESVPSVNVTNCVVPQVSDAHSEIESLENYQSSLDDGRVVYLDDRIFANSGVFDFDSTEKKYLESKLICDYLGIGDGVLEIYKIFGYNNNIIVVGHYSKIGYNSYGMVAIHNQTTNKNTIIKNKVNDSCRDCYMLGNKLYFSEVANSSGLASEQFNIKYLNLDTLEVNDVCSYIQKTRIEYGRFSVRKDGALALKVGNENGQSDIMTWHSGRFEGVVKGEYCELIEHDDRGVYYTAPGKNSRLISHDENGKRYYVDLDKADYEIRENGIYPFFDSHVLVLHEQNGKETVLLKSTGDDAYKIKGNGIKVFQDYFVRIQDKEIEKYDFTGQLTKKIALKQWPMVWKGKYLFTYCYVSYVNGELMDICYQRDTNEIDMQTVNLD